jgi:hypothetical protein
MRNPQHVISLQRECVAGLARALAPRGLPVLGEHRKRYVVAGACIVDRVTALTLVPHVDRHVVQLVVVQPDRFVFIEYPIEMPLRERLE